MIVLAVVVLLALLLLIPVLSKKSINFVTLKAKLPIGIVSALKLNTVAIQSNINEYQLTLNNKQYLLNHASEIGIFKDDGVNLPGIENIKGNYPREFFHSLITDISIILSYNAVDRPAENSVHIDTSPLNASVQFDEPRILTITVFLLPLQIQRAQTDPVEFEKTNRAINAIVFETLDSLVNKSAGEEKYFQYYKDLNQLSQMNKLPLILMPR